MGQSHQGSILLLVIAFASGMNVSVNYLLGLVNEKDRDRFFSDRKLFLKKVYNETARIEQVKAKHGNPGIPLDEIATDKRLWNAFRDEAPYPMNLITKVLCTDYSDISERRNIALVPIDKDIEKGVESILSELTEKEQKVIRLRFKENLTLGEAAKELGITDKRVRQVEAKALRKMSAPQQKMKMIYGERGYNISIRRKTIEKMLSETKEMEKEIKRIRENNDKETESPINLYTISVESLAFSNRAYNILKRQGLNTVGDIIDFYKEHGIDGLMKIRNMGRRSLDEILDKIGYHSWHFEYDDCD